MCDFKGFPTIDNEMRRIVQVARHVECDGFVNIREEEIGRIECHRETLTNEVTGTDKIVYRRRRR
jgi:hypothetical protein